MKWNFVVALLAGFCFVNSTSARADDLLWSLSVTSGDWNNSSNWENGSGGINHVPTGMDHALLYTDNVDRTVNYSSSTAGPAFDLLGIGGNLYGGAGMFTLRITGGTLQTTGYQDTIGGDARGAIVQTGGTYITAGPNGDGTLGSLIIGSAPSGTGSYSLSGTGSLSVARFEAVGVDGRGTFTQSAGTHSVGTNLYLGMHATGNGSYTLSNTGNLFVNGREEIGSYGTGVFNQSGGTNTIGGELYIARNPGSTGIYNLSGGTLNANGGIINNGTFSQTNGQNLPSSRGFSTGLSNIGTFNLASGSLTLSPSNNVTTGGLSNSGSFNLTSGSLILGNNANVINTNTFNITGQGNSGGVLGSGGWGNLYSSIQNNTIQTPIQQLAYSTPGTPVTGTITNSGNYNVTNTLVSYSASQVPTAGGQQVSLDYELASRFINSGGYRSDPSTSIFSNLINTSTGYLQGDIGDEFLVLEDFENMSNQSGLWNTDNALLGFVGATDTKHDYILSGQSPSFEWGSLYLALDNLLVIQSIPSTGLYFERIILEDVAQLAQITSNIDIYCTSIVDLKGVMLDISGYDIQGEGRLIQGNPVPEPNTMLLFGTGLAGLAAVGRRKRS